MRHKYFRKLRYIQKLETQYFNLKNKYKNYSIIIEFYTKDKDNNVNKFYYFNSSKNIYKYYTKPSIPYTITRKKYDSPRSGCFSHKKYLKKHSNKILRKSKKAYNNGLYKKIYDLWWNLW